MEVALQEVNLLDLRKSERQALTNQLADASQTELENLLVKIENTLSMFMGLYPENEEQVYLFGVDMKKLLGSRSSKIPPFRSHPQRDVTMVFAAGFSGFTLAETRRALEQDRRQRAQQMRDDIEKRKRRQAESERSLVEDIREAVAETAAASIVPPPINPRR